MTDPNMDLLNALASQYPNDPTVKAVLATAEKTLAKARLEKIATAVLAGLCVHDGRMGSYERFAEIAVEQARALISELDKEQP